MDMLERRKFTMKGEVMRRRALPEEEKRGSMYKDGTLK